LRSVRSGLIAVLFGVTTLTGCCDFEAPIDPSPTIPLDPALLGTWLCVAPGRRADEKPMTLALPPRGAGRHLLRPLRRHAAERCWTGSAWLGCRGTHGLERVQSDRVERPWKFVRYSFLTPQVLRLELVDDGALAGVEQTSGELREALQRRDGSPGVYSDFCVCVRVKTDEAAAPGGATPDAAK
jgi:hypothetical protein